MVVDYGLSGVPFHHLDCSMSSNFVRVAACGLIALAFGCQSGRADFARGVEDTPFAYDTGEPFERIDAEVWMPGDPVPADWTIRLADHALPPETPFISSLPIIGRVFSRPLRVTTAATNDSNATTFESALCDRYRRAISVVRYCGPTDENGLESIYRFPSLVKVDLMEAEGLPASALRHLCQSGSVRWIVLPRGCGGEADGMLAALTPMRELEVLWLPSANHSSQGLRMLDRFSKLTALRLNGAAVNDRVAAAISRLDALEHLRIDGEHAISDTGLQQLATMPSLQRLSLDEPLSISDEALHTVLTTE